MSAPLRWSASPEQVAKQLLVGRSLGFAVRYRHLLRWHRIEFTLTALTDLTLMDEEFALFDGPRPERWLVWQSASGIAAPSALPCDAAALCRRLGLDDVDPAHAAAAEAITALVETSWRQGGLPG